MTKKKPTVAPRERINITFKPEGEGQEEKELPFKVLAIGDYTLREDDTPLEDRAPISIDKQNFNDVMAEQDLGLDMTVKDELSGDEDAEISLNMKFSSLQDFRPESIAQQVPQLAELMELREALLALKGPLGNVPAFRKKMQELMSDEKKRAAILEALGIED